MPNTVIFGNVQPTEPVKVDPEKTATEKVPMDGPVETVMVFPDDMGLSEALATAKVSWWKDHSNDDPEFVWSSKESFQSAFAEEFNAEPGRPEKWKGTRILSPLEGCSWEYDEVLGLIVPNEHRHDELFDRLVAGFVRNARFLRTDAGKDFQSRVMGDTASTGTGSYASATWIALTANATAPAAGDTTLTGEITTAGGGLIRAQAVYAHSAGASTYTLTKTFTANASDALPVTAAKIGVFNASTGGTMPFSSLLSATAPYTAIGDAAQITETVTI